MKEKLFGTYFAWLDYRRHSKHLDECGACCERLMTFATLHSVVELLQEQFGTKPFLIRSSDLLEMLSGEVCPECLVDQIQNLNGGAK